ncbi:hypothetical protein D8B26_006616 [Coccidioides posadasii str. Silveira]|uniref:Uncharacterized protein n=3 Tax=Coccidioides posadasii TaxID=199306 RepID=E9CUA8_COCPS|nr:GRAM domain containing protein [Coccidioides posadasii C735 delta SOWgp]EER27331.1 GRAM domain containing protein [Coccidioides posadasii C735 delta SOWgp]EFW23090.1 hypothetical protein CPSG_00989 [Coccidioides posadasii str. Silveira]KMM67119.1 GRAM domain-containing protein 3 [Coccidioides posadasii RMSCC 3488]QVM11978.1 hypothetical protein D8B26_006616 [Coccidioides posadasii str. Silveira]|eukprot:XP_003069476.1 GRAM domain containing protein [Coccidioides posadasii C735 delta SOWgp]
MESNASESPSASSPNGLKIFTRPKRSRTTLNEIDHPYASDQSSRTPSLDIRPSTSHGSSVAPTGLAKFIPGAKRRQRRKTKGANNESLIDLNSEISGESRVSLPALEVNGERHRPITDPSLLMDDPEFGAGPPTAPHKLHADGPRTSPLITVSDPSIREGHHDTQGGSSAANSETASDNLNLAILRSTAVGVPAHSPTKENVGSSTGRKLRSAFNPRSPNRSSNTSPDRGSSKSSGSKAGKGFLGSAVRTTSFSSKKNKKSPEDIPPLPAPPKLPEDTVSKNNRHLPPLDTTPSTPPLGHKPLPVKTTVTPPTPTNPRLQENNAELVHSPESMTNPSSLPPNAVLSPSGNMISHRRVRSASAAHPPSKLSSSMTIPSTPSIDEKSTTPGSRNGQGNSAGGGFFSSMFSAAQNAASTLSIGLNQGRARNASDPGEAEKQPTPDQPENRSRSSSVRDTEVEEKKEQAIDTLGMGNLDFSHLGIDPSAGNQVTTPDGVVFTKTDQGHRSRGSTVSERDELAARIEDLRAARAVSMAYEKTPHSASFPASIAEDNQLDSRASAPFSGLGKGGSGGERTPPTASIVDGDISERVMRSGSLRSRRGIRRKRGSSAATSTTIGAIGAALGMPGAHLSTPRLTGFAVASKKRNRDFHQLFRSVPEDDYLIEDYSCALQREIILAGRIYISEGHICFSSNILGWVTTLVIGFDEIVAIEKESTAMVFPNAIAIQTLHARHIFRSLLSRDSTYDLMVNIWRINHPTLKSSVNGAQIEQGTGDKTEKAELSDDDNASISDGEEVYDEDEEGGVAGIMENVDSLATSDISEPRKRVARKPSTMLVSTGISSQAVSVAAGDESKTGTKSGTSTDVSAQFPGPKTHAPTEFTDPSGRYDKVVKDETIPAPLGQVYSLVFGAASTSFISKFLVEYEKVLDLQFEGDKKGLTEETKTRSYTYIKPLNSSIGPKQTKCISVEQLDFFDLEKAVLVTLTTQTPDVPNGNVFSVKTKYLFTWAPGNSTRFLMSCVVEWTGRSWIKGPIEKGANDGQLGYGTNLIKALKAGIAPKARKLTPKGTTKSKIKRTKTTTSELDASNGGASKADRAGATSWGLFEPFRGPLSPIVDIFKPFWSSNVAAVLVCSLLLMMWLRTPPTSSIRSHGIAPHHLSVPERLLAYDELWAKEESDLWDWLEDRVGMDGLAIPAAGIENGNSKQRRKRVHKDAEARLRDERMSEREIVDAIRVTQKRLETLQQVIDRRKLDRQRGESEDRAAKN